jgi:hypothetical protein
LRRVLGGHLLGMASEMACQGDHTFLDGDADGAGLDRRVPVEFGQDVGAELRIGFHECSFQ